MQNEGAFSLLSLIYCSTCDYRCIGFIFGCQYPSKWHHQPMSHRVLELLQVAVATDIFVSTWGVLATHLFTMAGTVWYGLESA